VGVTGFQWSHEAGEGMLLLGIFAWPRAFERRVDDGKIRRFEQLQEDHFEGQFEGQNGASERQSGLAPASVS
jgi:hypothetical protein